MSDDILTDQELEEMMAELEGESVDEAPQAVAKEPATEEPEPAVAEKPKPKPKGTPKPAVKAFIDPDQLKQDVQYSEAAISNAYADQASKFVHYAYLGHQAQHQADRLKSKLELMEARIDKEIREDAADEKKKITEKQIASQILLDARYQRAHEQYLEAKMIAGLAKEALEAFRQRRDMLIQVGADLREEMKGELRMRAKEERKSDLKDRALSAANG